MSDLMTFPKTWEEFEQSYGFTDTDDVYTNGARLIQSFRVKQWLEYMKMQTADAVQIVRCKECKNWDTEWEPVFGGVENETHYCPMLDNTTEENFFCSYGERR